MGDFLLGRRWLAMADCKLKRPVVLPAIYVVQINLWLCKRPCRLQLNCDTHDAWGHAVSPFRRRGGLQPCYYRIAPSHSLGAINSNSRVANMERHSEPNNVLQDSFSYLEDASDQINQDGDKICGDENGAGLVLEEAYRTKKISGKQRRAKVAELLRMGNEPLDILRSMRGWSPAEFWGVVDYLEAHNRIDEALQVFEWWKVQKGYRAREQHYIIIIRMLGKTRRPDLAQHFFNEMQALGIQPTIASVTTLLQSYAECSLFDEAEEILKGMIERGPKPNTVTYTGLIHAYGKWGLYDDMNRIFNNMKTVGCCPDLFTYSSLIQAYAKAGLFRRMESAWREMDSQGWRPDSASINAIIQAYADAGLVNEMHRSYLSLKDYRILVNNDSIRSIAMTFIRHNKFFQLGQFVKDVGLNRRNVGNLLWNLLILAFAANFQMKNVQRVFEAMKEAGFEPDVTTFNIRALAFSRMQMLWDLHITVLHMRSIGVRPDLVTFGAVVDAYLKGRLPFRKLYDALDELRMKELYPDVRTDPLVFEAFGKGDCQQSLEALLQSSSERRMINWTYGKLTSFYLKRFGRSRPSYKVQVLGKPLKV